MPIVALLIIAVLFLLYWGSMKSVKTDTIRQPFVKATGSADTYFKNISLSAKSAIVWDVNEHRAIYEHNADTILPLASLAKVMMAVTADDLVPDYTIISIKKEFLAEEGDSGLAINQNWRLKDLLDYSLTVSSNDGARAIASVVGAVTSGSANYDMGRKEFVVRMNEKAKKMGLTSTHFTNENGLDTNQSLGGAYGSARDMALLFENVLKNYPEIMEQTKQSKVSIKSLDNVVHVGHNTNWTVDTIPGVIASKTGYTNLAGGNLVITFDPQLGRPLIISVLGSTQEGRFSDVAALINASRAYLDQK